MFHSLITDKQKATKEPTFPLLHRLPIFKKRYKACLWVFPCLLQYIDWGLVQARNPRWSKLSREMGPEKEQSVETILWWRWRRSYVHTFIHTISLFSYFPVSFMTPLHRLYCLAKRRKLSRLFFYSFFSYTICSNSSFNCKQTSKQKVANMVVCTSNKRRGATFKFF